MHPKQDIFEAPYRCMILAYGTPLKAHVKNMKLAGASTVQLMNLIKEVGFALAELHKTGRVHMDLCVCAII